MNIDVQFMQSITIIIIIIIIVSTVLKLFILLIHSMKQPTKAFKTPKHGAQESFLNLFIYFLNFFIIIIPASNGQCPVICPASAHFSATSLMTVKGASVCYLSACTTMLWQCILLHFTCPLTIIELQPLTLMKNQ